MNDVVVRLLGGERLQQRFYVKPFIERRVALHGGQQRRLSHQQERKHRFAGCLQIQQKPQRFQQPAVLQQMGLFDHEHGMLSATGLFAQGEFQAAEAFFDRPLGRIGRRSTDLFRQISQEIAARHQRKHHLHKLAHRITQLFAEHPYEQRLANARRPGQQGRTAAALDRVAQFVQRPTMRFTRKEIPRVANRLERLRFKLPIFLVHFLMKPRGCNPWAFS